MGSTWVATSHHVKDNRDKQVMIKLKQQVASDHYINKKMSNGNLMSGKIFINYANNLDYVSIPMKMRIKIDPFVSTFSLEGWCSL